MVWWSLRTFQKVPGYKGDFHCGSLPSLFTCGIFLEVFFSIHWRRIRNSQHASVSALFQSREHGVIDEPVRPTVADRESWQKLSVAERNQILISSLLLALITFQHEPRMKLSRSAIHSDRHTLSIFCSKNTERKWQVGIFCLALLYLRTENTRKTRPHLKSTGYASQWLQEFLFSLQQMASDAVLP